MKTHTQFTLRKLTQRILCSALLVTGCSASTLAVEKSSEHTVIGLHVYVPVEYHNINAGDLNKYMGVAELPQVRVPAIIAGIGTQIQIDRIVLNASISRGGKRHNPENAKMSAPFTTYGFTLGYDLIKCPFMNLQPYAGIRMARMAYNYELESEGTAPAYRPHDEMQFRGNRGMIDLGIGASLQSKLLCGVRAGVLVPAGRTRWQSGDGSQFTGGPELSYRYYVGINFGFGRANIKVNTSPVVKDMSLDNETSFVY